MASWVIGVAAAGEEVGADAVTKVTCDGFSSFSYVEVGKEFDRLKSAISRTAGSTKGIPQHSVLTRVYVSPNTLSSAAIVTL